MSLRMLLPIVAGALAACSPAGDSGVADPSAAADPNDAAVPGEDTGSSDVADPGSLVAVIAAAAEARDYETLSAHMADAFSYSFGREPSREGALARYRKRPELLDELTHVLDQKCVAKTLGTEDWFICPAAAADESQTYYGWRAGFRQNADDTWKFVWFIAGD